MVTLTTKFRAAPGVTPVGKDGETRRMRRARTIRLQRDISISQVTRKTSWTVGHLSRFERGLQEASIAKLRELAALYQCSIDDLLADLPAEMGDDNQTSPQTQPVGCDADE